VLLSHDARHLFTKLIRRSVFIVFWKQPLCFFVGTMSFFLIKDDLHLVVMPAGWLTRRPYSLELQLECFGVIAVFETAISELCFPTTK
jgi:hypothetical protein